MVTMSTSGGSKKSIDFRMSKKVAELTQVVHMLFMRNHEKEVEIDSLKEGYEDEIDAVLKDAQSRIEKLDKKVHILETQAKSDADTISAFRSQNIDDLRERLAATERQLQEEKKECQSARDLLILARNDIERLREGQSEDTKRLRHELDTRNRETLHLKGVVQNLEAVLRERDSQLQQANEAKTVVERLQKDMVRLKEQIMSTERQREDALNKCKTLENDVKSLKRELAKRAAQQSAKSRTDQPTPASSGDANEEVERLRRQILRYRMELSNRESNFNRMFTDKQPVHVSHERKPSRRYSSNDGMPMMRFSTRDAKNSLMQDMPRNSENYEEINISDLHDDVALPDSPTSSNTFERLPNLSLDTAMAQKRGSKVLMKPKPLPRELISSKSPGYV